VRCGSILLVPLQDWRPLHVTSTNQTKLSCELCKNSHSLQFHSSPAPHTYQPPWFTCGDLRNLGLPRVIFIMRHIVCYVIRRQDASNCFRSLLAILRTKQTRAWHEIMTLDELWLDYIPRHELIWFPDGGKVAYRARVTIHCMRSDWVHIGGGP
jgi:hypothetical protein